MANRIHFLLHLPPPVHGSSLVGKMIYESKIINQTFDCRYTNLLASQNIAETGKVNIRKLFDFVFTFLKVLKSILWQRPQLCYLALSSTGAAFYKDLLLVVLLRLFKIKRVFHLHNKGISLHQNNFLRRVCYKFVFKDAEVILLSKYLYYDIQEFVFPTKVHICPNGIHYENKLENVKEVKHENEFPKILFLSNLLESKGVFVLLEAMALLAKNKIQFSGVLIGGEGDITASSLNDRINQLGLNKNVTYIGRKFGNEKHQAFSEADIFAFPTTNETFGLVNLEAMQHSLPIVSTFEGGIPDVVEDEITGFLIPQNNVELLAEKLEILIKNPQLRKQMGEAGRRKYENEFTFQHFENKLTQILNLIVDKTVKGKSAIEITLPDIQETDKGRQEKQRG